MRRIWLLGAALAGLVGLPEAAFAHDRSSARLHFAGGPRIVVVVPSRPFVARHRLGPPHVFGHRPALRRPVILRPGIVHGAPFRSGVRHFAVQRRGHFIVVPRRHHDGFHFKNRSGFRHFAPPHRKHFSFAPRRHHDGFHFRRFDRRHDGFRTGGRDHHRAFGGSHRHRHRDRD